MGILSGIVFLILFIFLSFVGFIAWKVLTRKELYFVGTSGHTIKYDPRVIEKLQKDHGSTWATKSQLVKMIDSEWDVQSAGYVFDDSGTFSGCAGDRNAFYIRDAPVRKISSGACSRGYLMYGVKPSDDKHDPLNEMHVLPYNSKQWSVYPPIKSFKDFVKAMESAFQ